ncbi:hypothetical protein N7471_007613 [Penicillium samsonianum]|uniref:uncharacterized protein n=1 Tax=Penicillium samsonianum TaxID=1882272 RepID=UPI00254981CC|nr:uncharacterized protein N7471_007613 [Penicillium samsonianum]KAJ6132398.1 hypothetical protein N7471_007613 [Penicillium samsonianum]
MQFSPACPIPYVQQPTERIEQLKAFLKTDFGKAQQVNVYALIRLYETGELGPRKRGDPPIYLVEGQRVENNPWEDASVPDNAMRWCEVHAHVRIPPQYGGDSDLTRPFLVCNDTGSNVLTLFTSDLLALQFDLVRHGAAIRGVDSITTANGPSLHTLIFVDMQILTSASVALTPWFRETAILKPDSPGEARLSGAVMRNHLFFATAPGNARLYVAQKKAGIIRDLPVRDPPA